MATIKRRASTTGRTYTTTGVGYGIRITTAEHGYKVKLAAQFDYAALTDRQSQGLHKTLYEVLTEALADAANARAVNVPLFDLEEIAPPKGEGINTR